MIHSRASTQAQPIFDWYNASARTRHNTDTRQVFQFSRLSTHAARTLRRYAIAKVGDVYRKVRVQQTAVVTMEVSTRR